MKATKARAAKRPPQAKPTPTASAGYSGTPLVRKLGVHASDKIGLVGAPDGFEALLDPLPEGVALLRDPRSTCDLWLWFPRDSADLVRRLPARAKLLGAHGIWICWPKKSSGVSSDLDENRVREAGLAIGLVDFKVCAIDATFSGLKLTWRRGRPQKKP